MEGFLGSVGPQPGQGVSEQELAAKVAASFEAPKPPQVTQPEATQAQPDHKAEAAAAGEQLKAVQDKISSLSNRASDIVSAPARQLGDQVTQFSHPDSAEQSIRELLERSKGPAELQMGANQLRLAHVEAHHDLEEQAA